MEITINLTDEEILHFKQYRHDNKLSLGCDKIENVIKKFEKEVDKLKIKITKNKDFTNSEGKK